MASVIENEVKEKPNLSKKYILPLLLEGVYFNKNVLFSIINTYLKDNLNLYQDCIYIRCKFTNDIDYMKFDDSIINLPNFKKAYNLLNNEVVYIIDISNIKELNLFLEGRYSEYNITSKNKIIDFFKKLNLSKYFLNQIERVFRKDPSLKKEIEYRLHVSLDSNQELERKCDINGETINLKDLMPNE